jgi:hypothetical protein
MRELLRQVLIGMLLALLSILGYDRAIVAPALRRTRAECGGGEGR